MVLMRYRLKVEIEYLIALSKEKSIKELGAFSKDEQTRLRKIYQKNNGSGRFNGNIIYCQTESLSIQQALKQGLHFSKVQD